MSFVNEKEMAAAEKAAVESTSQYTHTFATPLTFGEKTYEQLTFDFGKLTGADFLAIELELQMLGKAVVVPELSGEFLVRMAARAAGIGSDVLIAAPLYDYNQIRHKARSFLLKSGL